MPTGPSHKRLISITKEFNIFYLLF
uniref:Uncharacterized protein n=1 Tax=Macrostomum lignano TaxID=282301 RepID=A0A1I8F984_9PLAT